MEMSPVINPGDVRAGCIYRISLQNFLTFSDVTLFPGKSLNLIIGPNGTGKSSILCAIILGLGGKPSVIQRADTMSKFVKIGCQEAVIEIELYRKPGQENVIIKRTFNIRNRPSTWYIDNKNVDEKKVLEQIARLHIQVDNLCQLLPQDRVHDFSKKEPPERLLDTLAIVGPPGSVDQLMQLKSWKSEQTNLKNKLQHNLKTLGEYERRNNNIKKDINIYNERKEIEKKIETCNKKILWLEYLELKKQVIEFNSILNKSENDKKSLSKSIAFIETDVAKAKSAVTDLENAKQDSNSKIRDLKYEITETIQSIDAQDRILKHEQLSFKEKITLHSSREDKLKTEKAILGKLYTDKALQQKGIENNVDIKNIKEIQQDIHSKTGKLVELKRTRLGILNEIEHTTNTKIRYFQKSISDLENLEKNRLDILKFNNPDTYKAVEWLSKNKNMFKHSVHRPMVLEINFTNPKFARYLEVTVATRDLVAFTFESKIDMNEFTSRMREMGLKQVNAVHSDGKPLKSAAIRRDLGFYVCLIDTVTAPDAILSYLCTQYNIHNIPIGNKDTYNKSDRVPSNIRMYFSENHKFTLRTSKYSQAVSTTIAEVRDGKYLAKSVDIESINKYKSQLSTLQKTASVETLRANELEKVITAQENATKELHDKLSSISTWQKRLTTITMEINKQEDKIKDIENMLLFDVEVEKAKCKKETEKCVTKQCNLHQELLNIMKNFQNKVMKLKLNSIKLEISREAIRLKDSELRDCRRRKHELEETLQSQKRQLDGASSSARQKEVEIRQFFGRKLPTDPGFPGRAAFDELPSSLDAIQQRCIELRAKISCMSTADEQVIVEYKENETKIKQLKTEVNLCEKACRDLENNLNKIKSQWLPSLEKLISKINKNFSQMFKELQYVGEVILLKESDDDFEKYGIDIYVKFRAEESLSRFTRFHQSGGERTVTTAVYLMALQGLSSTVPFRCVDEINQGMDALNERKMLDMLLKVTTQDQISQYFVLTPKLLPNLQYNDKVKVHTIMNGKHIMDHSEWEYEQFLEKASQYRPS